MSSSDAVPDALATVLRRVQTVLGAKRVRCYIVGGLLRDQLLGRPRRHLNVDLAVPRQALALARRLADALPGAFVPLDDTAGCARVVVSHGGQRLELDVSDFRGPTLEADLARRDFTVNAIAVSLPDWLQAPARPRPLIDPLDGATALRDQRLVPCFPGTFEDDPLRILRAFRFSSQLGFTLAPEAEPLMRPAVARLTAVAGERVREELLAICETDQAAPALRTLEALGALDILIPELVPGRGMEQGDFHHLDVLGHQLETVRQADRFLRDFAEFSPALREPIARYCAEPVGEEHSRKSLIKLAGLLHDIGKPERKTVQPDGEIWFLGHEQTGAELAGRILERLRLSHRESDLVRTLVLHHLRPGFLSREPQLTRRAVYRFYKDLGAHGPACLLTWWADRMATRGPRSRLDQVDQQRAFVETLLQAYFFQAEEVVTPPRLIDGHRLMEVFRLPPGPRIGELLAAIEEAQAEGRIRSSDEALALARQMLNEARKSP